MLLTILLLLTIFSEIIVSILVIKLTLIGFMESKEKSVLKYIKKDVIKELDKR